MDLGEFLKWLIEHAFSIIPFRIVYAHEGAVRFLIGKPRKVLGPGLHWFIPIVGDIRKVDGSWDVLETSWITHTIAGQEVSFTVGLPYRIVDAEKLLVRVFDADTTMENKVCCIAGKAVADFGPGEEDDPEEYDLAEDIRCTLPDLLDEAIPLELDAWGLECGEASIISCTSAQALRLLQDASNPGTE